jgi:hypothetical protein
VASSANVDGPEIRCRLPEDLESRSENLHVYMTQIGGYPGRYDPRARRELEPRKPDLFICGHTHIARVMRDEKLALLHINPGASGHASWHKEPYRDALRYHRGESCKPRTDPTGKTRAESRLRDTVAVTIGALGEAARAGPSRPQGGFGPEALG